MSLQVLYHIYMPSFDIFETILCYVAQVGFILAILLPQAPEYWDYRSEPLCSPWIPSRDLDS